MPKKFKHDLTESQPLVMRLTRHLTFERQALLAICALGLAVRLYNLDVKPIWWDEGNTVFFGRLGPLQITAATAFFKDLDPPVFRLLTGAWTYIVTPSPFVLRFLPAALGVLCVPLVWAVGRSWLGRAAALGGALLTAVAPVQMYYSQEAKGYTFIEVTILLLLALWRETLALPLRQDQRGQVGHWTRWLAGGLLLAVALGAHYLAILIVPVGWAWLAVGAWVRRREWRAYRLGALTLWWTAAQAIAGLLFLPWTLAVLAPTIEGLEGSTGMGDWPLPEYLWRVLGEMVAGQYAPEPLAVSLLALSALSVGLSLWYKGRESVGVWLFSLWLVIPLALGFLFQARFPFFSARFLLYSAPALALLTSAGFVALVGRIWPAASNRPVPRLIPTLALTGALLLAIPSNFDGPYNFRENWGRMARWWEDTVQPGDVVVYVYPWQVGYIQTYLPGIPLHYEVGYFTPDNVDGQLSALAARHRRIWLMSYKSPSDDEGNLGAQWLSENLTLTDKKEIGYHELTLYERQQTGQSSPPSLAPQASP